MNKSSSIKPGRPTKDFSSIEDAMKYAKEMKIGTSTEWRRLASEGKIPEIYPKQPDKTYKKEGWKSWKEFLGKQKTDMPT